MKSVDSSDLRNSFIPCSSSRSAFASFFASSGFILLPPLSGIGFSNLSCFWISLLLLLSSCFSLFCMKLSSISVISFFSKSTPLFLFVVRSLSALASSIFTNSDIAESFILRFSSLFAIAGSGTKFPVSTPVILSFDLNKSFSSSLRISLSNSIVRSNVSPAPKVDIVRPTCSFTLSSNRCSLVCFISSNGLSF